MSKQYPIQNDFSAGQLSERMAARSNDPKFITGLSRCENFIPTPQGPLVRRKGTKHMYQFASEVTDGRIEAFQLSDELAFDAVFTNDGKIRFFTNIGLYANPATPDDVLMDAPVFDMPAFNMRNWTQSNFVFLYEDSRQNDSEWALNLSFNNGDLYHTIMEFAPAAGRLNDSITVSFNIGISAHFDLRRKLRIGTTDDGSELGIINLPRSGLVSFDFNPNGASLIYFSFHGEPDPATNPNNFGCVAYITSMNITQESLAGGLSIDHWYDDNELDEFQAEMHPSSDEEELWLTHKNHQPYVLRYTLATGTFTLTGAITENVIATPPPDWSTPPALGQPPQADANFPTSLTFHQGRLWFGGTHVQPNGLYASAADSTYVEFATPNKTTSATAITVYIAKKCIINWLESSDDLLIGTNIGIFFPVSSTGLLATTDITANLKVGYGTNKARPVFVSTRPVYISFNNDILRDIVFTQEGQEYNTKDLSFEHQDILKSNPISRMDYNQDEQNLIQCESLINTVLCLYNKFLNIVGFGIRTQIPVVKSIRTLRNSVGSHTSYLMLNPNDLLSLAWDDDINYLDDNITIINPSPVDTVLAPHLADQTVSVLADGILLPSITLDATGAGTISQVASNVVLGFPYSSIIETMPKSVIMSVIQNTYSGFKNWNKIYVSLQNSTNPKINGIRKPDILENGATGAPVESTKRIMQLDKGWDDEGKITIEQDQPFPCTILAIYGEMSEEL